MKKIFKIIVLTAMMVFLGSCTKPSVIKSNVISSVNINDREKFLISNSSDKWMIYDFKVNNRYKELKIWVEKYEFGKFIERQGDAGISLDNEKNKQTIIFTINEIEKDNKDYERIFNIKVGNEKRSGRISFIDTVHKNKKKGFTSWQSRNMKNKSIKGKMLLGWIICSQRNSMNTFTEKFYSDVDKNINEIKNYDVVYLLRCEFIK